MKHVFFRLVAVVLIISTIVASLCLSAQAATTVQDFIYEKILAYETEIDVSSFNIKASKVSDVFCQMYFSHPELFYCSSEFRYGYVGDTVRTIYITYKMDQGTAKQALKEYNSKITSIIAAMPSGLSDLDKVIWIHEYVLSAFEYDYGYNVYDAYNMLMGGKGVCEAYALIMIALLNNQGIECSYRFSEKAEHAWVAVKLGGYWYNIDPTWDDPKFSSSDGADASTYTEGIHKYLLVSDSAMLQRDQNNNRSDAANYGEQISCSSTKYDNAFWKNAEGLMAYLKGKWYYIDSSQHGKDGKALVENTVTGGETKRISIYTDYWRPIDNPQAYYKGTYSGVGVYNGSLYVNGPKSILRVNPSTGELATVYTLNSNNNNNIYRSEIVPGSKYISLYIDDVPYSSSFEEKKVDLSSLSAPTATPTAKPTATPTAKPTATPTAKPTATPTAKPTATPTAKPTDTPTAKPMDTPTATPTATPTVKPSTTPTPEATSTAVPTVTPEPMEPDVTATPTPVVPDVTPTPEPTEEPTPEVTPTAEPTKEPVNPIETSIPSNEGIGDKVDSPKNDGSDGLIAIVIGGVSIGIIGISVLVIRKRRTKTTE